MDQINDPLAGGGEHHQSHPYGNEQSSCIVLSNKQLAMGMRPGSRAAAKHPTEVGK